MHCGLCLPVCPTYALTGMEKSSPRGRIRLMKSVMEGALPVSHEFAEEMNFCLDCQACETACPAGVKYGELVESARVLVDENRPLTLKKFILRYIVSKRPVLKFVAGLLRVYQISGIEKGVLVLLRKLSSNLYARALLMPRISRRSARATLPETIESQGNSRGTVAVLTGCVMDVFYSDINVDTVQVLVRNNWKVVIPRKQVCCGSLSGHYGDSELPKRLARENIKVFEETGALYYVINSAGCGAFMKGYASLLSDDPEFSQKAARFSSKVLDFSEFLFKTGYEIPQRAIGKKTVYHEACHLVHSQKVSKEPNAIVSQLAGTNICELNESTWCCGSAGIYNIVRYEDAAKLLERKMENIIASGAEIVITGNPGCLAQIDAGIKQRGLPLKVVHPATVLNRLYKSEEI